MSDELDGVQDSSPADAAASAGSAVPDDAASDAVVAAESAAKANASDAETDTDSSPAENADDDKELAAHVPTVGARAKARLEGQARKVRIDKDSATDDIDGAADGLDGDGSVEDADEDSDREAAVVGASSAGSARAAVRGSGTRSGVTAKKGEATKPRDSGKEVRLGLIARLSRFLKEVVAELRKVIWPARNQMITYTIVVIVFVVFMVALTSGLDIGFAKLVLKVFG